MIKFQMRLMKETLLWFYLVTYRGVALQWIKSYPFDRTQFVQYSGYNSSSKYINCGVPQGSILGSIIVLLYVNDLCNVSKALDFILFADDTNILFFLITTRINLRKL